MRCLMWIVACSLAACRAHVPVEAPRFTLDEAHPIVGRVLLPPGTPKDEHVELALFVVPSDVELPAITDPASRVEAARTTLAADGTFRLPRPRGVQSVALGVVAKHLWNGYEQPLPNVDDLSQVGSEDDLRRLLGPDATWDDWLAWCEAPVEVRPLPAAEVVLTLLPPPGAASVSRALVGRRFEVQIVPSDRRVTGAPWVLGGTVEDDLEVALGAVPAPGTLTAWFTWVDGNVSPLAPLVVEAGWRATTLPGADLRFEVPMVAGLDLGGRVVDAAGEPVAGAHVIVESGPGEATNGNRTSRNDFADAEGAFSLRAAAPPIRRILVQVGRRQPLELEGEALERALESPRTLDLRLPMTRAELEAKR